MARNRTGSNTPWQDFNGPNLGYVHELYESYLENPESIDQEMKKLFDQWGAPALYQNKGFHIQKEQQTEDAVDIMQKAISAATLALNIRINDVRKRRQEKFVEQHGIKLGFMSFFTKAVTGTLKAFPLLNAEIRENEPG